MPIEQELLPNSLDPLAERRIRNDEEAASGTSSH